MVYTRQTKGLGVSTQKPQGRETDLSQLGRPGRWERTWSRTQRWSEPLRGLSFERESTVQIENMMEPNKGPNKGYRYRDELFTGRHRTMSLAEFEYKYLASMSDAAYSLTNTMKSTSSIRCQDT